MKLIIKNFLIVLTSILSLIITPTCFAVSNNNYTLTTLGTLGGERAVATSINKKSQIVGFSTTAQNKTHAFIYQNGKMTDLGTFKNKYSYSEASDINDNGVIVGASIKKTGSYNDSYRAVEWINGKLIELGTLNAPNDGASAARSINNKGDIVGESQTSIGPYYPFHAFIWRKGVMTDLGTLGGLQSFALGINSKDQVVGYSLGKDNRDHAFIWEKGQIAPLFEPQGYTQTIATAINDKGVIVGYGTKSDGTHALLWKKNTVTDLGILDANSENAVATSINKKDIIVGQSTITNQGQHPFVWEKGQMIDLAPKETNFIYEVYKINDKGLIVGTRQGITTNSSEAFLWTPSK